MTDLGLLSWKRIFTPKVFELMQQQKEFVVEFNDKGIAERVVLLDKGFPCLGNVLNGEMDGAIRDISNCIIFESEVFNEGKRLRMSHYNVYYVKKGLAIGVPYRNVVNHTYHWFITDIIYSHDEYFKDNETDRAVYEDTLREEYLSLPLEEREEKTYVQYVNNCLSKNGTLRREK